jgi:hypothetical protein
MSHFAVKVGLYQCQPQPQCRCYIAGLTFGVRP